MGLVRYVLLLLLISASFAVVIDTGPSGMNESASQGKQWADATAALKCNDTNVQAVYECLGNVVRVVSSVSGEGSTFYLQDGKVVKCPVVSPTQLGALCVQMLTPNFCPTVAQCGKSPTPQIFPGQNGTAEQDNKTDYYIIPGEAASETNVTAPPQPEPQPAPVQAVKTVSMAQNNLDAPAVAKNNMDSPIGYLVLVVLLLGVGAVGVLFMLFRNSISEDLE